MLFDPVLFAALAALGGGVCAAYPRPVLVLAPLVFLLLARGLARGGRVVVLGAFALGAVRGNHQIQTFESARIAARDAIGAPSRCDLTGVVVGSPTWADGSASFVAELSRAECGERLLPVPARVRLHGGPDALARGDQLHVIADLAPLQLFRNQGTADPTPTAARQGIVLTGGALLVDVLSRSHGLGSYVDRARAHARLRIVATFAPGASAMARALVLGENDLPNDEAQAFQKSGLSHMLAVSGTHLIFAVAALVRALSFLLVRVQPLAARYAVGRFAALLGVPLALIYADFAGGSGSAWRAAVMLSVTFSARALGRKPLTVRTFGLSTLLCAAFEPLCAFDLSFLLSMAATAGLIWLGRPFTARCEPIASRSLRWLAQSFATTLSATIPCAPLLALLSSGVTLAGLVANVVAAPLGEAVALPLCLGHLLLSPLPALERGAALVASGALLLVKQVALASARESYLALKLPEPNGAHLTLMVWFVLGLAELRQPHFLRLRARLHRRLCASWVAGSLALYSGVEWATARAGNPHDRLRISALDVGQGDANLVDLPNGAVLLIDGGGFVGSPVDPGKAVILPVMRARRRTRIDVAVLSHPHPDHFTGLLSALAEVDVGELWDTGQGEAEGAGPIYAELLRSLRARGVRVVHPDELCGAPRFFGAARVRVLAPCPSFTPHRGANDNSLVLAIDYGARRFLLMGDAEHEEEADILASYGSKLRADYLKVGHHGSRTSTGEAFLSAVAPSLATLSCGVRNRFGHPHAPTLARLAAHGVSALRLDRSGSVSVSTDGSDFVAESARVPR